MELWEIEMSCDYNKVWK